MRAKYNTWLYEEAGLTATLICSHCDERHRAMARGAGTSLIDRTAALSRAARQSSGLVVAAPCPTCGRRSIGGWLRLFAWGGLVGLRNLIMC